MIEDNPVCFFTATILEWKHLLKDDKYKDIILNSMKFLVQDKRAEIFAFVIMPNHIHMVWRVNNKFEPFEVQRDFLKFTAQQIKYDLIKNNPELLKQFYVSAKDRQYQIWERNPLSIELVTKKLLDQKILYIHGNPIQEKWQLSETAENYKYSSARFYDTLQDEFGFLKHYWDIT